MLIMNKFANEVHEAALLHGILGTNFTVTEVFATIHLHWTNAFVDKQIGKPILMYSCKRKFPAGYTCKGAGCYISCRGCRDADGNPEGTAVDLIDGCLMVIDFLEGHRMRCVDNMTLDMVVNSWKNGHKPFTLEDIVVFCHDFTSKAYDDLAMNHRFTKGAHLALLSTIAYSCRWIMNNGLNPEDILHERLEYLKNNIVPVKKRPYIVICDELDRY